MSKEPDSSAEPEALQVEDQSTSEPSSDESEALQGLMQPESSDQQASRLNDEALAAAEEAVAAEESASHGRGQEQTAAVEAQLSEPDAEPSWILRGLLILNLVLMGVMLALPNATDGQRTDKAENQPQQPPVFQDREFPGSDPFVSPVPKQAAIFGESWSRASQLAGAGNFEAAVKLLSAYIEGEGAREPDFIKRQVYRSLGFYSYRLGDLPAAAKYDSLADGLASYAKLPLQLIREAEEAEAKGDGRLMRQAYARLLLIQSQMPPSEFDKVSEAYLKLADSFRLEAKRGEEENK